jgi:hypothetical protein
VNTVNLETLPAALAGAYRETGPELLNPSTAAFESPAKVYRYELTRTWNPAWPAITWIMLNPSTAGAHTDDPTIGKITRFSRRWAAGGIIVVNLFAYRSAEPAYLRQAADPVGDLNDAFIDHVCAPGRVTVAAWGAHGALGGRGEQVAARLRARDVRLCCLGLTRGGQPRHPLYVSGSTPLQPYREPG